MNAISKLPDIPNFVPETARLPAVYSAAQTALAECERIDECKTWADKMEALASYARQSNDDTLRKMCDRIQARAIRRCGELIHEIPPARGANQNIDDGAGTKVLTRKEAAAEAGLSERQRVTAQRVASVPAEEFEKAVEADEPATVTKLAEAGTVKRPAIPAAQIDQLNGRDPSDFLAATRLLGGFSRWTEEARRIDLDSALRGCDAEEREALGEKVAWLRSWTAIIERRLKQGDF